MMGTKADRMPTANVAASIGLGIATETKTVAAPGVYNKYKGMKAIDGAKHVPIGKDDDDEAALVIADPDQPRKIFNEAELRELASSIKAIGVREPIGVRWSPEKKKWVVIDGGRRLLASRMAGKTTIPAVLDETAMSSTDVLLLQLVGNIQRVDLQPVEAAESFQKLMDANGWTALDLAGQLRIDHDKVLRTLGLNRLDPEVRGSVKAGEITATTGFEIGKIEDPIQQREVAARVKAEDLSRAETVALVKAVRAKAPRAKGVKGRGAKPKPLATSFVIKATTGHKITVEHRRGVDPAGVIEALEEIVAKLRSEQGGDIEAA